MSERDPNRIVALLNQDTGEEVELPTRPGPFTIGGPDADVCIRGEVGIVAIAEVDGAVLRVRDFTRSGRNDRCPCGSGRKFKRCCAN